MANFMYRRKIYLDRIRGFLGKPVVKVIPGMRRVGKSTLLRQIIELLHEDGVSENRILYLDMESLDFEHIRTYRDLQAEAKRSLLKQPGMKYLLVDEVQKVPKLLDVVHAAIEAYGVRFACRGTRSENESATSWPFPGGRD